MAINNVLVDTELVVSAATVVLGYGVSQTVPPRYLLCNPTAAMTVTLPLSTAALPTSLSTPYVPGAGAGVPITIMNMQSTYAITIAAATGDTLVNVPVTLTSQYSSITMVSDAANNRWVAMNPSSGSAGGAYTVTVNNLGASSTSQTAFVADANYIFTAVTETHGTASSSGTLQVEKATGTQAIAAGTNMLTGTISLAGTANTPLAGTLVTTASTVAIAAGNRVNLIIGGTMTSYANGSVVLTFVRV